MDIYQNQTRFKWIIVGIALVVALVSLVYTNWIANQLKRDEYESVDLFAKTQEFIATPSDNGNDLSFIFTEIIDANQSIPVILEDTKNKNIVSRNLDIPEGLTEEERQAFLKEKIEKMKNDYEPIKIQLAEDWVQYIYYDDSDLLTRIRYYPIVQLSVIGIMAVLAYSIFSYSRRSEQNRVWAGLAKETAHQLGTPISSLMAWIEYFRSDPSTYDESINVEIEKDVQRLQMITSRFSSIGSEPNFHEENIPKIVEGIVTYLEKRVSTKVKIKIIAKYQQDIITKINVPLFEWVIENICKNAVDAMDGKGKIDIYIRNSSDDRFVQIDIHDTGKGIPKSKIKTVFQPGYTTKKRGWGLGLALVKRIVENYHKGKIFVKKSDPQHGTTFRILIPN